MAPKIKEIAELLNLSPATVSMALNDRPGISPKTKAAVFDAVKKYDYRPVSTKRASLAGNENLPLVIFKKHGKVVGETPFFSALIESIEKEARQDGFRLSIHYLNGRSPAAGSDLCRIVDGAEHGFLLLATEMSREDLALLPSDPASYVLIDNAMTGCKADKVLINNFEGAYSAVRALISLGHSDIGYLHSKVWINNFEERFAGYRSATAEAKLELREDWIIALDSTHEGAYADMRSFLERRPVLPTAFFADNDIIAMGAVKALKELGIDIPGTVSIIGFDDMPFCTMVEPSLSTMRVDIKSIGSTAVRLLLQRNPGTRKIEIDTSLILRNSTMYLK